MIMGFFLSKKEPTNLNPTDLGWPFAILNEAGSDFGNPIPKKRSTSLKKALIMKMKETKMQQEAWTGG